ncbi:DUF2306 domain-containing protein [Phenylobacterium soli]|uniref:DUF2306 domain-containing protein n=1 Tax=Phenylobacterium soli TaxID=2170551 RepID=UPI001401C331|nr:DUF2306 domain-containing protein [Phenylobacterium soli]
MKRVSWIVWIAAGLFCIEVGLNALRYLLPGFTGPEFIMHNPMAYPWLFVHAGCGAVALLIGPLQFLPLLRARGPRLHRWLGRGYMVACLASGAAGVILAPGSTAGPVAVAGFGSAAVISLFCAVQAWRMAMARRFDEHREWVIRSFALIFAAVTLRIWLPASQFAHLDFMESYRAISFLGWVPNLIVAEFYIDRAATRRGRRVVREPISA